MSLSERIQQINREISATVDSALAELRRDVAERVRASSEEIARHVEELAPRLPASFLAHEDLSQVAESMAREAADQASREAAGKAAEAAEAAARHAADRTAEQVAAASRRGAVDLRDALQAVDRARSQADILAAVLSEAQRFAGRTAVLLVRGNEMRGWGGHGFGDADAALRTLAFTPGAASGWARLAQAQSAIHLTAADAGELCSRIEAPLPHEGVLIPLVLRDRIAAGLYADRAGQDGGLPAVEALQILCYTAAQAIELLPFRERASTATLAAEDGLNAPPPPAAAAAPAAPAEEMLATARIETVPQAAPPSAPAEPEEVATAGKAEPVEELPEIEIEAEPEPPGDALVEAAAPWEPAPPEPELEAEALPELPPELPSELPPDLPPDLPEIALEAEPEPEPAPQPPAYSPAATVYQPIPREALGAFEERAPEKPETPPPAPTVTRLTTPMPLPPSELASTSPDETVMLQRPSLREVPPEAPAPAPPAPPPLRSVPPPAPEPPAEAPSLAGIPEVKPPSGVEGPGWAFAASRVAVSPNEEALHEEARRLARLLVSEIKLYNEEQVEEGRRKKDVYERLKEDIDRSRQMYEERVEPRILKSTDYFYQELVRILAAGDSKALGI